MKRQELNNRVVFEKLLINAQMKNDCTTLARLIWMILNDNPDLVINFKFHTMDELVLDKLREAFISILKEEEFNDKWSSISQGVYKLLRALYGKENEIKL